MADDARNELAKVAPDQLEFKPNPTPTINLFKIDLGLRLLVVVMTMVAVAMTVSSHETKLISSKIAPFPLVVDGKFTYSPALIYLVVANSMACLYGVVTVTASVLSASKRAPIAKILFHFTLFDSLMAGIVASATGAGASIAYLGIRGNSHVGWLQICNFYTNFCRHIGSSILISLVASIVLVLLVWISAYSVYHRIPKIRS